MSEDERGRAEDAALRPDTRPESVRVVSPPVVPGWTEMEMELASVLYEKGKAAGGPSPSTRKRSRFWKAVAAECLRQMEWSRRMCACDRGDYIGSPDMPLTLAPDDWKPPEP
jgi:hypothetical protein